MADSEKTVKVEEALAEFFVAAFEDDFPEGRGLDGESSALCMAADLAEAIGKGDRAAALAMLAEPGIFDSHDTLRNALDCKGTGSLLDEGDSENRLRLPPEQAAEVCQGCGHTRKWHGQERGAVLGTGECDECDCKAFQFPAAWQPRWFARRTPDAKPFPVADHRCWAEHEIQLYVPAPETKGLQLTEGDREKLRKVAGLIDCALHDPRRQPYIGAHLFLGHAGSADLLRRLADYQSTEEGPPGWVPKRLTLHSYALDAQIASAWSEAEPPAGAEGVLSFDFVPAGSPDPTRELGERLAGLPRFTGAFIASEERDGTYVEFDAIRAAWNVATDHSSSLPDPEGGCGGTRKPYVSGSGNPYDEDPLVERDCPGCLDCQRPGKEAKEAAGKVFRARNDHLSDEEIIDRMFAAAREATRGRAAQPDPGETD